MGVSEDAVERAKLLASDRYVIFVADLYGRDHRPGGPDEAGPLADALRKNASEHRLRISAALDVATERGTASGVGDPSRRAAIGFCFGGGSVLELARGGAPVAAVVSIHGDLTTPIPARPGDIRAAILALHGSEDPISPKRHRDALEAEMQGAAANWRLLVFGGLIHAFTDVGVDIPGIAKFDEPATRTTYELTHRFLEEAFAGQLVSVSS